MADLVLPLTALGSESSAFAGGKGASLGELVRAGVPVPRGFVVSSAAFDAFLAAGDPSGRIRTILRELAQGLRGVRDAADEIGALLGDATVPAPAQAAIASALPDLGVARVSVRSSATCEDSAANAWAGQLETYLDVVPEEVADRVADCWRSAFRPEALSYGAVHGYGVRPLGVAVVVQTMVPSEISGIAFSVDPLTQQPEVALIEACIGLGEAIVSGQIEPDRFLVERASGRVLANSVGRQRKALFPGDHGTRATWGDLDARGSGPKLTVEQATEYAGILDRIHRHYGRPVDTEWARADGQFQVLQARPITTLAEEYAEELVDPAEPWAFIVRRPMSLFEASIWAHWIDTPHAGEAMGLHANRALAIEDDAGIANLYLSQCAVESGLQHIVDLHENDRPRLLETLNRGLAVREHTEARLGRGPDSFASLEEAAEFFIEVGGFTTCFPAWTLIACENAHIVDPEVLAIAQALRGQTLYPAVERQIIEPLLAQATRSLGFSAPAEATHVVSWHELRDGTLDRGILEARREAVRRGRRFLHQLVPGAERTRLVSQTGYLILRLAPESPPAASDDVCGQAAWPGIHRARARVVLAPDAIGQTIEDGEVLVSIQSSPALMPLLRHAGAIVTDEGGVACHAAILCRELRIPTIIGTQTATSSIRTGDLIEVDAYAGVVRILERENQP